MKRPRYSIVVPTRQRHETLHACLRTVVEQASDDYEIVVADNASSPETRAVCESFGSPRLRHVRCDEPLSMNDNWERALDAARGEWVTFLGDDDGLMPYALAEFDVLTSLRRAKAIRWQYAIYTWPCMAVAAEANRLQLARSLGTRFIDRNEALSHMLRAGGSPAPMIYYGLIHRSLIDEARRTGRVFDGLSPDYHSGVLFAHLADRFLSTDVPLSIAGLSGRSNGVAHMRAEQMVSNPIAREFDRLNKQAGFAGHPDLPDYGFNTATIVGLDPLFRVRDRLFPHDPEFRLPPEEVTAIYLRALSADPETRAAQCDRLRQFLAARAPAADFDTLLATHAATAAATGVIMNGGRTGRDGQWEVVDTSAHGVTDVHGASQLAARLLGYEAGRIPYDLPAERPGLLRRLRRSFTKRVRGLVGQGSHEGRG
ncbi:MAG: glycosyltransferase family 2 protein [Planctomycetota bacterium]